MAKKLIFITAIPLKCDCKMINFLLGGVDNQKTEFRQILIILAENFQNQ